MSTTNRVAVHAEAARLTSGGGMTYVTALAAALAEPHGVALVEPHGVDLFLPFACSTEELSTWMPAWPRHAHVRREPPNRSWRDELRLAVDDRHWPVTVRETSALPRLSLGRRSVLVTSFPFSSVSRARDRVRLASYATVITNSAFSARWVADRWRRPAQVLHPPVTTVRPNAKQPVILSVGRFSGGGRPKRQLEMVDAFRRLGPAVHRDWALHLAGFAEDPAYVDAVRARAGELPVTIHTDLDRASLERLYGDASIFWHACGLGVDQDREPQRVEHFGITTAEAMSAGCVPVVIDAGGQPEIVGRDGEAGVLWHTVEEWVEATRALIEDEACRARLATAARARSARFSFDAFAPRARALVHGREHPGPGAAP